MSEFCELVVKRDGVWTLCGALAKYINEFNNKKIKISNRCEKHKNEPEVVLIYQTNQM